MAWPPLGSDGDVVTCLCVPSFGCVYTHTPRAMGTGAHRPGWQDPRWPQVSWGPGCHPLGLDACWLAWATACLGPCLPPLTCWFTTGSHSRHRGPCRACRRHLWWVQEASVEVGDGARPGPLVEGSVWQLPGDPDKRLPVPSLLRRMGRRHLARPDRAPR